MDLNDSNNSSDSIDSIDTVLFVDDEKNILNSIRRELMDESFDKLFAGSGDEALQILQEQEVAVLVTDMRMPGMTGLDLLKIVQEKHPDVIRIILTAYSHISTLVSAINSGQVYRYLTKPWKLETDFIPAIRQALEFHRNIVQRKHVLQKLKAKNLEMNKRNFEIQSLLKQIEKSDAQKSACLCRLNEEVVPYVTDVLSTTGEILESKDMVSLEQILKELRRLNEEGGKVTEVLKSFN